jgi:hypothetical protein
VVEQRPTIVDDVYRQLGSIVGDLQARRIRVVFFTPPYSAAYRSYYKAQDANAIAVMQRMLERLGTTVGAEYYDFSNDSMVVDQPAVFADSDHLNVCGKRLFTKAFGERILARRASRVP